MMNYEIFKEVVKEKFMDYMPDNFKGMELVVMPVEKVNMTYDGISIRGKDTNISPTIYINDMYEKYQNCGDLEETLMAACDLMAMEFAKTPQVVDVDSLYKDADEKVVFQLINTEQNKSFLEQVPHREFQDLSIIYKLVVNADTESIQSIKVTNSLAERLGMNEELITGELTVQYQCFMRMSFTNWQKTLKVICISCLQVCTKFLRCLLS